MDIAWDRLPGNAPEYGFSVLRPMEDSPLQGGRIGILGSSVVYGAASLEEAVGEYLAARLGTALTKEAVSGTTLTDMDDASYIQRMLRNMDPSEHFDLFICQLSTNDATKGLPLGRVTESFEKETYDTKTIIGAMEYIIAYAKEIWKCPVCFFTGSRYESEAYGNMYKALCALQRKWGIGILDLWTPEAFNAISDEQRELYMRDPIHPTKAGYRDWWGPELLKQLLEYLA